MALQIMNSRPRPSDIAARKRDERRRAQQISEADEIYTSLIVQRGFVRDLIHASAKRIGDPVEAADVRLILYMIVRDLVVATGRKSPKARWEAYKHHFISNRNREEFFTKLRRLTRRVASAVLVTYQKLEPKRNRAKVLRFVRQTPGLRLRKISKPTRTPGKDADRALQWDSSLLPENVAPWVLRLAILHPGVLEHFLPRFFVRASDCLIHGSTYRRALFILDAVPELGWSAEKHTRRLIGLGEIHPSEDASEVETVKKFIRDLRRRHKTRLSLTQPKPVQGTSSARKAAV